MYFAFFIKLKGTFDDDYIFRTLVSTVLLIFPTR